MQSTMASPPKAKAKAPDAAFLEKLALDAGHVHVELATPPRPLKVLVGTWNVGNKMPPSTPDGLHAWIPQHGGDFDVIAIGLQESSFKKHVSSHDVPEKTESVDDDDDDDDDVTAAADVDPAPVEPTEVVPVEQTEPPVLVKSASSKRSLLPHYAFFQQLEDHVGASYTVAGSIELMEIRLIVFVHTRNKCTDVEKTTEATGVGNVIGNKGGTVLKLVVDGVSLCFVNCHLAAHEAQKFLDRRNSDCSEILNGARIGHKSLSLDHQFDHAFWFGDMNYRINLEYSSASASKDTHWDDVHALVVAKEYAQLNANDQLAHQLADGKALVGWRTAPCLFPPTFKRVRGQAQEFLRQRVPSYCDRILWTSLPGYAKHLTLTQYDCVESITTSDHKPVFGAFEVGRYNPQVPPTSTRPHQSLEVTFAGVSGENLLAMDLTGTSDPYIKFYCTIPGLLVDDEAGKHHPQSGIVKGTVNPAWSDDAMPTLKIKARLHELEKVHLVLALMDYDATSTDDALGEVVLCLADLYAQDAGVDFERKVVKNGVGAGILRGTVTVTPSTKALADWEKPPGSSAVPGCSCATM